MSLGIAGYFPNLPFRKTTVSEPKPPPPVRAAQVPTPPRKPIGRPRGTGCKGCLERKLATGTRRRCHACSLLLAARRTDTIPTCGGCGQLMAAGYHPQCPRRPTVAP